MKKIFIHTGKEHLGPFDLNELKIKGITPETPVWYQGLDEWTTAGKVDELHELFEDVTPPPYRKPEAVEESHTVWTKALLSKIGHLSTWRWIQISSVLLLFFFLMGQYAVDTGKKMNWMHRGSEKVQTKKAPTQADVERSTPTRFIKTQGTYTPSFWGHKMKIRGTVKSNATKATYKDVVVRVVSYDSFQKELSREDFTLNDTLKPNSEIPFDMKIDKALNLDTIKWTIVRANPVE